jgi:hypothetical protein
MSVNWSKYSRPIDVIIGYPKWGIARLMALYLPATLPQELKQQGEKPHKFCLEHAPEDDNYSHCQIACFKGEDRVQNSKKISETAKKEFKTLLSNRCFVLLDPQS